MLEAQGSRPPGHLAQVSTAEQASVACTSSGRTPTTAMEALGYIGYSGYISLPDTSNIECIDVDVSRYNCIDLRTRGDTDDYRYTN